MVASRVTTYLYAISLILVYGSLPLAFVVGASDTAFAINGVLCIMSLALLQGLRLAITGKTVSTKPGFVPTQREVVQSDGVHTTYGSRWSSGTTFNARDCGFMFGGLSIFFGLLIGFSGDMSMVDTFPVSALLASAIIAIIGAMAYKSS